MSDFDKIAGLLYTMQPENVELAFDLAESQNISLRPLYDQLARVLSDASFQANVGWMNLPLPILLPQLQRIFSLSIEASTITELPPAFGLLQGIYLLEISHCDIATVADTFGHLHRLTSCSFVDTHISDLPDSVANIPRLQNLYLRRTKFEKIPDCIARCRSLRTLDVSENPQLRHIDWSILRPLTQLRRLIVDIHHHAQLPFQYHAIAEWVNI